MSTRSSLKDLSGPRVRVRAVPRVASGSRGKFLLQSEPGKINGPQAALALAKRHLSMREAHTVVTRLFDHGEAVVELPAVESIAAFTRDLAAGNGAARASGPPPKADVKAIPQILEMSQEQ